MLYLVGFIIPEHVLVKCVDAQESGGGGGEAALQSVHTYPRE